jgi:hypothetical protein
MSKVGECVLLPSSRFGGKGSKRALNASVNQVTPA